jgi:hypothetical protein
MAKERSPSKASIKAAADRAAGIAPDDPSDKKGRPSSFKPEFVEQARKLCELGATDIEIADFFDVSDRTVYRWQLKYPEFCQALKAGKLAADDRVERSLYHRATGYSYDSEKVFQFQGEIIRAPVREHVPPDTTSMIFWLKNRRPDAWRDVHKIDATLNDKRDLSDLSTADLLARTTRILEDAEDRAGGKAKGKDEPSDVRKLN